VLVDRTALKIRLYGIDSPECGQAFGNRAKQLAAQLAFKQIVRLEEHDVDGRGRIVADVYLPDGRLLNEEMVRGGLAWWYQKYAPENRTLEKLEAEAKSDKRGLWTDPNPIPPWDYRMLHPFYEQCQDELGALQSEIPGISPRSPPLQQGRDIASLPILGNRKSHIYHRPDCPNYAEIAMRNRVPFKTAAAAEAAGYRRAKNCP
jgi:micrococcal nuclease